MKFHVLPYTLARCFIPEEPTLAIRIFDPGCTASEGNNNRQKLVESPFWVAELHYTFADFDPYQYSGFPPEIAEGVRREYQKKNMLLTPLGAKRIIADFQKHKDRASAVLIHCNAGLSRSPTVALFLCHKFNITPEWVGTRDHYMKNVAEKMQRGELAPNTLVWDLLSEVSE